MTKTPIQAAETPESSAPEVLRSTLEQLRLQGALFFRSEFSDAFTFESNPLAVADQVVPGANRLVVFHIVAHGSCWVATDDGVRHWADEGDVIVLPYGDRHRMGGQSPAETVTLLDLVDPPPWDHLPVLRHGGGGPRTDIVCGYLHSTHPLFDEALRALPPLFVVRLTSGSAAQWVRASIDYAMEETVPSDRSTSLLATRLPELVVIEVLRDHLASAPAAGQGWISALADPVLAPALSLLHRHPARRWTVAELAAAAAVSRSSLDERFRQVLARSPIRYLTEWRMHLAEDLLATTDLTVFDVARRVGYEAEEAFSRAFKRERGLAPAHWRNARTS